jgi:Ca-activated chloride channel family protein
MTIEYPHVIWALLGLVPIVILELRNFMRGRRDLARFTGRLRKQNVQNVYLVKWFFSTAAFVLFYLFAVLALAGFFWGQEPVEEDRRGLDVTFAVDVSRSMLADDVAPSRLARSKGLIRGMVEELPGSRFALVVFKGQGITAMPMTQDTTAIQNFLESVGPSLLSSPGSDIESGLSTALNAFPDVLARNRVVVLFSDGESLTGRAAEAARTAAERGIPVFSVGVGTEEGSAIIRDNGEPIRDRDGQVVISRLDEQTLRRVAERSGGGFYRGGDPATLGSLLDEVRGYVTRQEKQGFRLVDVPRYRTFLSLALVFFVLYTAIRVVPWRGVL